MQVFETKLILKSTYYDVEVEVPSTEILAMLRAVHQSKLMFHHAVIEMFLAHDYKVISVETTSTEVRDLLDIMGQDWVHSYKISAIRLVRKFTNCSLLDAKNAVEGYSA